MARRLPPWHWLRVLRRDGPDSPNVHLVLHVLATFMSREGECWPSQQVLVAATRLGRRTVQRALLEARRGEWLAVRFEKRAGQDWRLSHYAATVPDSVDLTASDFDGIAITWAAQYGRATDPLHGTAPVAKTAKSRRRGGVTQTPPRADRRGEGGVNRDMKVASPATEGGVTDDTKVASRWRTKSSGKSSRKYSEEGHTLPRATCFAPDSHEDGQDPSDHGTSTDPRRQADREVASG